MISIAAPPNGERAIPTYTWSTNDGELQTINVPFNNRGSGYDPANPPTVLVGQPQVRYESEITVSSARVAGYDAVITSIVGTDNGPPGVDGQIEFSIFKTTPGGTVDELVVGDYIVISNTSVGPGNIEAVGNAGNDLVGFGTEILQLCLQGCRLQLFKSRRGGCHSPTLKIMLMACPLLVTTWVT